MNNKKAFYNYEILEKEIAGICLIGSEMKPVRNGDVNISDSYIYIKNKEVFIKNMYIKQPDTVYKTFSRDAYAERKLLLTKKQIVKIKEKLDTKGLTLVPIKLFFNDKGICKLEIGLAKGKKLHDKRNSIKEKDIKRDIERNI